MANLALLLEESARLHPERTALVAGLRQLSYRELDEAANRVARLLISREISPGDKIALSCTNVPEFTVVYYGILKAGATVVPLNIMLTAREVEYHLRDSDAVALFAVPGLTGTPQEKAVVDGFERVDECRSLFLMGDGAAARSQTPGVEYLESELADQPAGFTAWDADDDDTAVILYTSGTTGQPKGAELSHRNLRSNALVGASTFGNDATRPDTYLCVLPLFHSFAQTVLQNGCVAFGGTLVVMPAFDPAAVLETLVSYQVTFFAGVPTMFWKLLDTPTDEAYRERVTDHLRVAISGGAALPVEIHRRFREQFGVTLLEGYGLSETSPVASFTPPGAEPRVGSVGQPIEGVRMKLIEDDWSESPSGPEVVGEIAVQGPNVMKGYYGRPEATAEVVREDWFRTGDLARKDEDGYYYIVDRAKDMIIRGGYNVYPRELEDVLMTHPEVSLASVIGMPDEALGEEIAAFVVRERNSSMTRDELIAWSRTQLAAYKYPRVVTFVEDLPTTATGKVLKRALVAGR